MEVLMDIVILDMSTIAGIRIVEGDIGGRRVVDGDMETMSDVEMMMMYIKTWEDMKRALMLDIGEDNKPS